MYYTHETPASTPRRDTEQQASDAIFDSLQNVLTQIL